MKENTLLYSLPKGWVNVSLGEIILLQYGKSLTGKNRKKGVYAVWGSNGIVGFHNEFLVQGPVIIIGRKGSVGAIHLSKDNCWPIDTTYFISSIKSLNCKFVYFLLKQLNLENLDKSTTIPGLNRENVYKKTVILPPLNEQRRIVAKIEELLSELDDAEEILIKAQKQLKVYRESFLKKAFTGGLTNDWRKLNHVDSADILVKKIKSNRARQYNEATKKWEVSIKLWKESGEKYSKPSKPVKATEPLNLNEPELLNLSKLPQRWKWIKIGSFDQLISAGSTPKGGRYIYQKEGIPFIRSQNVYANKLVIKDLVFISNDIHEKMSRTKIKGKDVLLNITGASIGRSAFVPDSFLEGNVNQHVCIIRTPENVLYKYLSYFLNSAEAQIHINKINSGATREALTLDQIKNFPFPLCSYEEQVQIVQEIEYRFTIIDNLQQTIKNNLKKVDVFFQVILKKGIEGKLVPQDEDDQPADQLLTPIKNEIESLLNEISVIAKAKPKKQKSMESTKTIIDILKEKGEPISSKDVWLNSIYYKDIDAFYTMLKLHIENNEIVELPRNGKESLLMINKIQ